MNGRNLLFLAILFQALFIQSCSTDQDNYSNKILGHWEVVKAFRNGKETSTLQNAYFEFSADGKGILNLDGSAQAGTYKLDDNLIKITGTSMDAEYTIESVEANAMILNVTLRNLPFRFELTKAE